MTSLPTRLSGERLADIVKPSWAKAAKLFPASDTSFYVTAFGEGASLKGPERPTKSEAIAAFNELFGDKP